MTNHSQTNLLRPLLILALVATSYSLTPLVKLSTDEGVLRNSEYAGFKICPGFISKYVKNLSVMPTKVPRLGEQFAIKVTGDTIKDVFITDSQVTISYNAIQLFDGKIDVDQEMVAGQKQDVEFEAPSGLLFEGIYEGTIKSFTASGEQAMCATFWLKIIK